MTRISERLSRNEELMEEILRNSKAPKRSVMDKIIGKKKLTKEFSFPKRIVRGHKKKVKQNYALVVYIRENGYLDFKYAPIVNDMIFIKETGLYHIATADYMLNYVSKGKTYPTLIQTEWSAEPFSKKDHSRDTTSLGARATAQKQLIQIAKDSELKGGKSKIAGKTLLFIIIAIIVVLYLLNTVLTG